ncbi:MAG: bifunctional phosphopantothenoylcysteine decarboxylase/phosphopantothenate--cysteine ligase CoaBC [Candidatus Bipolaricaulis sp.]|nr:bifunctional phosphopantothenoylcysteine decarboxylase/phosphopantothenate--cysteine ligase CoaBC [Candidatus Bipolaricaulis sp.]
MAERTVVLGVTGSIAAYKAVDLASRLTQSGVVVHTVMTKSATQLVGPATFRAITGRSVSTEMFELTNPFAIEHVSLADAADLMIVAPATADVLAKMANGIADDLLTCTLLATRAPVLVAPAMHTAMWEHPATRENVERLRARGVALVGPAIGRLASGGTGVGRFAPVEDIVDEALRRLGRCGDLAGRRIVVTAGGTHEAIDPIRFLGNRSSGKMGYAIAEAARDRGADVILVSGPAALRTPGGMSFVPVTTAAEMLNAVRDAVSSADVLVMAAAVADYTPAAPTAAKLKKTDPSLLLQLKRTADVLGSIGDVPVKVGFAAETEDLIDNARAKLRQKNLDLVVANLVGGANAPFGSDENEVALVDANGAEELPRAAKRAIAERILDRVAALLAKPR